MEKLMKPLCLLLLALYALGVIGGVGYTLYYDLWYVSIGVLTTGILAFDNVRKIWSYLKP